MRYLQQPAGHGGRAFNETSRPALDKLPPKLVDKLQELDRIRAQVSAALTRVNELSSDQLTAAAIKADNDAATEAAKAGEAVPPPTALPQLEQERATAAHVLTAQQAAFTIVESEAEYVASDAYWASLEKMQAARAAMRTQLAAKAAKLADAVVAALDEFAVYDWLRSGIYSPSAPAMTWPCDVVDLERHNLTRKTTTPVDVRSVLVAAATTCLEEPTEN